MSEPALHCIAGRQLETQHITVPNPQGTIVLLHEALGSVSHWRDFPSRLSERCNMDVLLYSRLGHGQSEGPPSPAQPKLLSPSGAGGSACRARTLLSPAARAARPQRRCRHRAHLHCNPSGEMCARWCWNRRSSMRSRLLAWAWRWPSVRGERLTSAKSSLAIIAIRMPSSPRGSAFAAPTVCSPFRSKRISRPVPCPLLMLQGAHDEYATDLQAEALRRFAPADASDPAARQRPHPASRAAGNCSGAHRKLSSQPSG